MGILIVVFMILSSVQISDDISDVGLKTKNLARLLHAGFCVPEFMAISATTLMSYFKTSTDVQSWDLQPLVQAIIAALPSKYYAVRSSALIEDNAERSYAGQFLTKVEQPPEALEKALKEIIVQALDYLHGQVEKFSVIVQVYIVPDFAGVTFTRNPQGGREMIIEYHQGKGEDVVGGTIKPSRLRFYHHQYGVKSPLPDSQKAFETFKKIENLFGFAQDIEWAVKDGKWYFLQARPLTTLAQKSYEEALFLDSILPAGKDFLLEKTEISEIAPRPTVVTADILEKLYAPKGPIQRVYQKYGIRFTPRSFLKIVGNELYVDREVELQTLFPAYSNLARGEYKASFCSLRGSLRTLMNMAMLSLLSTKNKSHLSAEVFQQLEKPLADNAEEAWKDFMKDYELIFEINLLTQKSFKIAEVALQYANKSVNGKAPSLVELLYDQALFVDPEKLRDLPNSFVKEQWQGNSLELSDETPFLYGKNPSHQTHKKNDSVGDFQDWIAAISPLRRKNLGDVILQARFFNNLREYGRWLTVRHIHHLRTLFIAIAKSLQFAHPKNIFFATISEIFDGILPSQVLQKRRAEYELYFSYHFPSKLSGKPFAISGTTMGISRGKARGILTDLAHLHSTPNPILFTVLLSTDLTQYFTQVKGVISEQGGLLSHLAIIARESHIPVIVNAHLEQLDLHFGDHIEIDGGTGEINKIS